MSTSKLSSGDTPFGELLKNTSYYFSFTDPTSQQMKFYKMDPATVWANLKSIQRKLPDDNKLCPRFDSKTGLSRLDAWNTFLNSLRAYMRTIGGELLDILDAGEFLPPFPQCLPSELLTWLPEWLLDAFQPSEASSTDTVKLKKKLEKLRKVKGLSTAELDPDFYLEALPDLTPSKIKKRKARIGTGEEEEVDEDNIRSISSLVPDPVTCSTDKDKLVIAANVRSPIFKQMVQPYHVRLMMEANSIYIALVFFIDILIRDRTIHDDDDAKQAHSYAPVGNLFLLLHFLEQCMVTSTTLLSDRRILDFSSRPISFYANDLNLRKYYLELLKEAKLIKSHNPETDVENPDNVLKIVFSAISKLNVTMARQFKQLYVMYDNN